MLHTLAGSYVLGSLARSAFVIQPATDEPADDRVVWTCCKNNDGELGSPSVWQRQNGIFTPFDDFDWDEFNSSGEKRRGITEEDLAKLFDGRELTRKHAVSELMEQTGCKQAAAYNAFKRFQSRFDEDEDGLLAWKG